MPRSAKWRKSKRRYKKTPFQRWLLNMMEETELFNDEVAEIIGCHPSTITQYMIGEIDPAYRTLQKFRDAFGCDMNDLFTQGLD
jgi:transcriptional regulator with XRE-family HTH domain